MLHFVEATSNDALDTHVCGVCARDSNACKTTLTPLAQIPNSHHLMPTIMHPSMMLNDGLIIEEESGEVSTDGDHFIPIWIECEGELKKNRVLLYTLSNRLWLGAVPLELASLTVLEQMLITLVYPQCFVFKMHPVSGGGRDASTLQCGMVGNVTIYNMETSEIIPCSKGKNSHVLHIY